MFKKRKFESNIQYQISEESAMDVLQKILDYYEIDPYDMGDDSTQKIFEASLGRALKAIRQGRLKVDDIEGLKITQTFKDSSEALEYQIISGKHKMAMSGIKDDDNYGKIYALVGSMTGVGQTGIANLKGADLSLCEVLGALFLSV